MTDDPKDIATEEEAASKYDWILDMRQAELHEVLRRHEKDALLVYQHCGFDVLVALWEHLSGIPLYISKKALHEMQARYVRQNYDPKNPEQSSKFLAARLGVSEKFVWNALATTDRNDKRQQTLFPTDEERP